MATSSNLAQGGSNGNTASRAGVPGPGSVSGVANFTKSPTLRAASYIPPVTGTPSDVDTRGVIGGQNLAANLRNQAARRA